MTSAPDFDQLLPKVQEAAIQAGAAILKVYHSDNFEAEHKADDSPLTLADRNAHNVIAGALKGTDYPVLSEEGKKIPYEERKNWEYFWMVDPLDGTKEFIKKNGEFTVNIALIAENRPVLGVIYTPVLDELFWAADGKGAWRRSQGKVAQLKASDFTTSDTGLRIVGSRSHLNDETKTYINQFKEPAMYSMGSSLKFMLIAQGEADIYPRLAPTMEWDTAAAQIIVEEAGGSVLLTDAATPVQYNKENLLNPHFLVFGNKQD